MLLQFITLNRDDIIRRCRAKVGLRSSSPASPAEIDHGVPLFLDQLVLALGPRQTSSATASETAMLHGHDLLVEELSMPQVVRGYGDLCQSITELAAETGTRISTADFGRLNGWLDSVIANHAQLRGDTRLDEFITLNRDEIIRRCRAKVALRSSSPASPAEIDHGVPLFLDQLVTALRLRQTSSLAISQTALLHGHDLLVQGLSISQVVHDYGDVCQAITALAVETHAPISTADFGRLNSCLDSAIAGAVTQYGRERDQASRDGETTRNTERLGFFAHELNNLLHTALLAFEVVKSGNVGVVGTTGTVLQRSLLDARDLVARALAETRLTQGIQNREPFLVVGLIVELTPAATLASSGQGLTLVIMPIAPDIAVEGDRQVLSAVLMNLLQNAFKFTHKRSTVTLRVSATADRVQIEVEDECGGLPGGDVDRLFRPFEQRDAHRTGRGLGLAFSRWATEANRGHLSARDLPGAGCVFTVNLPRYGVPAVAAT